MRNRKLDQYLKDVAEGRISPAEAAERLRMSAYDDIDFAKLDTNRELRTGRGEVVFGLGKTPEQVASIMRRMAEYAVDHDAISIARTPSEDGILAPPGIDAAGESASPSIDAAGESAQPILATKVTEEHYARVQAVFADGFLEANGLVLEYNETAKMIIIRPLQAGDSNEPMPSGGSDEPLQAGGSDEPLQAGGSDKPMQAGGSDEPMPSGGSDAATRGLIVVVSGGTADMPIAEEAAVTAALYGHAVTRIYDVGISGLHRLLDRVEDIRKADVIIAVAGMEGALASVISGLVACPVVAVPTSIGYGITLSGLTPLFAMLGSCSLGIGVMNIDNGFGAAHYASMILGVRETEER